MRNSSVKVTILMSLGIFLGLLAIILRQEEYYVRSATLEPKEVHLVSSTSTGIVQKVHFKVGDKVQEGEILLEVKLDDTEENNSGAAGDDVAVIRAPISGTILSADAAIGQRITSTQQDPIFSISDLSTLYAIIGIPDEHVHAFTRGMTVSFTQDRDGGTILARNLIERIEPEPVRMRSLSDAWVQAATTSAHRTYVEIDNSDGRFYPKAEWWAHIHINETN